MAFQPDSFTRKPDSGATGSDTMTVHALGSVASLERALGSACTILRIDGGDLLAGSQEGTLACWSVDSGSERWRIRMTGPISDLAVSDGRVYAAASSYLHALEASSGEVIWSHSLEGASDYVQVWNGIVWAASSVYEIDISDYIESTVWMFDSEGSLKEHWTFPERAWHFGLHDDGGVLLGLGRPRCGLLRIRRGEGASHHPLVGSSPVTAGACDSEGRILIGHSDGSVSVVMGSATEVGEEWSSPVRAICGSNRDWLSGHDSGEVVSSRGWAISAPGAVESLAKGPSGSEGGGIWVSRWDGATSSIVIVDAADGSVLLELEHGHRIRHIQSEDGNIALGDSSGRIHLIEEGVLSRRLEEVVGGSDDDERRSRLMERLRQLRNA